MTTDFHTHKDLFVSPHSVNELTALEDPKFEVNSSIKHEWAHFLKKKSLHPSKRSLIQTLHYINKMTKIRCSKITKVIHNMLCIKVMDGLQAFMTTCVYMWEFMSNYMWLISATVVFAREDGRGRENCWDFGISIVCVAWASRLCWLDGQQATEFEVLNHRELLQTLEMGGEKREGLFY